MKIVCLGDSLTFGDCVRPEECWVSLLTEMTSHTWINAGICGDTTGGMLARLNESVFSHAPDAVLLLGGVNDILVTGSWDLPKANMMALVHQCVARGVLPIVGITLPVCPTASLPWTFLTPLSSAAEQVQSYCDWLRLFAGELKLRTVDFRAAYEAYLLQAGWERAYQPDGLHPSAEGHRVMAETAAAQKFLRSGR